MSTECFQNKVVQKTRKTFQCQQCYLPIPKGSKSHYYAGKFEGDFFTQRMHVECNELYKEVNVENDSWEPWSDLADVLDVQEWISHKREIRQLYKIEENI